MAESHRWIVGPTRQGRQPELEPEPDRWLVPPISANRRLGGPYTATAAVLRAVLPQADSELVRRHAVELLTVAPDLDEYVPNAPQTLTSSAIPAERTRYYAALRTLRIAHGISEFLIEALRPTPGRRLIVDDLQHADYTDQELFAVLLRRLDPGLLQLVIGSTPTRPGRRFDSDEPTHRAGAGLFDALDRWAERTDVSIEPGIASSIEDDPDRYIELDGTDDRAEARAAYWALSPIERAIRHDARAAQLPESVIGAAAFHRYRGTDPILALRTADEAMNHCMRMGFYDAAAEWSHAGRELADRIDRIDLWWRFTAKLPTILSAIGLGRQAETVCDEARARTSDPHHHHQLAYATAMLYTRHLNPTRQDHELATGWANTAIAFARQLPEPKERALMTVFYSNGLALIEAHRRRPEAALTLVTEGLAELDRSLDPGEHALHRSVLRYNRAQVLSGLGRLEESLADYRAVIAVDPNYPEYHFDAGNLLRKLGRPDEALAEYAETIRLGPPFPEVFYNRADLLFELGELEAARAGFDYVLELDPDYLDALVNRAGLLADLGEADAAATDVERGLALAPDHAHLLALRGRLRFEAGALAEAAEWLDRALTANPDLAEAWAVRGAVRAEQGQLEPALTDLDRAVELADDDSVFFNRGCVALALGRFADAEQDFTRFIEASPDDPDGWQRRADCRQSVGDETGAAADRQQAEALSGSNAA